MEKIKEILRESGFGEPLSISSFQNEEGAGEYAVWKAEYPDCRYVVKRAKGNESQIYDLYLKEAPFAPRLVAKRTVDGQEYLILTYINGNDLMRCSRSDLMAAVNTLFEMQSAHWNAPRVSEALESRKNRRRYLQNELLEQVYDAYLSDCEQIPWTLCHDDLLPFNVITSEDRVVFIDWEHAGILPYPAPLARLIAHTSEDENALFYMKREDIADAINLYYEQLLKPMGISYDDFRHSLDLHLFYEYCEWVYVGNKYGDTDGELLVKYSLLATNMAKKLIPRLR